MDAEVYLRPLGSQRPGPHAQPLTRSPLAREDFDIFQSLGDRLLLGISFPTLDRMISGIYEPKDSHPRQRLKLLTDAHEAGIHTFVAVTTAC